MEKIIYLVSKVTAPPLSAVPVFGGIQVRDLTVIDPTVLMIFIECTNHPLKTAVGRGRQADFVNDAFCFLQAAVHATVVAGVVFIVIVILGDRSPIIIVIIVIIIIIP